VSDSHDHDSHDHDSHDAGGAPGIELANQVIDLANAALEAGATPEEAAAGLRHAAANFSAFAFFHQDPPRDPNPVAEEFISLFEHYLNRHKPTEPSPAEQGLAGVIAQAKKDF
jgi:hypothetical protein